MFYFVESGKITEPIYSTGQASAGTSNKEFLRTFVGTLLQTAFPNLQALVVPNLTQACDLLTARSGTIQQFVEGLFAYNGDVNKFKTMLRDFLIQLKEFSGDNAELFAEDREQEAKAVKDAERERAMKVGGLLKPAEIDQDDEL